MMRPLLIRATIVAIAIPLLSLALMAGRKKKNQEPKTEVLPLPPELPMALAADTANLEFRISPLLRKGRLSSQIRQSLDDLIHDLHGGTVVKLRAFVSGAGDSRRVDDMVSALFTDKKLPLPVLTIVQVGALGDDASAVVIEAVVAGKRALNPNGLAFFAGERGATLSEAVDKLAANVRAASIPAASVATATCFAARIANFPAMTQTVGAAFPNALVNVMQPLREPLDSSSACEAVARLPEPAQSTGLVRLAGARASIVSSPQVVFTGLQLSFGTYLDDADSALARLQRAVAATHADMRNAAELNAYSLNPAAAAALRKTMPKFDVPPSALTVQLVEGLPSLDAALGMEAVLAPTPVSASIARR